MSHDTAHVNDEIRGRLQGGAVGEHRAGVSGFNMFGQIRVQHVLGSGFNLFGV